MDSSVFLTVAALLYVAVMMDIFILPGDHTIFQYQHVHAGPEETVEGLLGRIDDGLIFIKGSIQQNGHPRLPAEGFDQIVIPRAYPPIHGLQSARSIGMRDRG